MSLRWNLEELRSQIDDTQGILADVLGYDDHEQDEEAEDRVN